MNTVSSAYWVAGLETAATTRPGLVVEDATMPSAAIMSVDARIESTRWSVDGSVSSIFSAGTTPMSCVYLNSAGRRSNTLKMSEVWTAFLDKVAK